MAMSSLLQKTTSMFSTPREAICAVIISCAFMVSQLATWFSVIISQGTPLSMAVDREYSVRAMASGLLISPSNSSVMTLPSPFLSTRSGSAAYRSARISPCMMPASSGLVPTKMELEPVTIAESTGSLL